MQNIQNAKQNSSKRNYFIDNNGNFKKHGNLGMEMYRTTEIFSN